MNTITKKLDFSGGKNSWFDFWHTHIDWNSDGNKSWNLRKEFLDKLLTEFENVKSELKKYPSEYQTWIMIDENDSGEDGIYIHTKNPNSENFPLKVQTEKNIKCLKTLILYKQTKLKLIVYIITYTELVYYFYI